MHEQLERPYQNGEKYLFVSYAHKNTEQVVRVVDELRRHHIRVWYDEGIHGGRDWSNILTGCIDSCEAGLVFVSRKSVRSRNCRNEIDRLNDTNKEIFPIVLEEFDIPQTTLQRINRNQFTMLYRSSPEEVVRTLYAEPEVRACYTIEKSIYQPPFVPYGAEEEEDRKPFPLPLIIALAVVGGLLLAGGAAAILLTLL